VTPKPNSHDRVTSTLAEKTVDHPRCMGCRPGNLRVCGEGFLYVQLEYLGQGLPPRARRRHLVEEGQRGQGRVTSVRAEKTFGELRERGSSGGYLRARGEDAELSAIPDGLAGLPPRARRRLGQQAVILGLQRVTSARAEKIDGAVGAPY